MYIERTKLNYELHILEGVINGRKGEEREGALYRGNLGLLGHQAFPLGLIRQRNQTMQWEEERGGGGEINCR